MIYISCDIETTGLDPLNNEILSVGAIIEDTEKKLPFEEIPKFHCAILHHQITGSLFAINMNRDLIGQISRYQDTTAGARLIMEESLGMKFRTKDYVVSEFFWFLYENGLVDGIVPEPLGGAHHQPEVAFANVKSAILENFAQLEHMDPEERIQQRIAKFSQMGVVVNG